MSLKHHVLCTLLLLLSLNVSGQQSRLELEYESIIDLNLPDYETDDRIKYFFKKNENTANQQDLALCYHEYAKKIYYTNLQNAAKDAIAYTEKAIAIREKYKDVDPESLRKSLYNLGFFYEDTKNYFTSIANYQKLIEGAVEDRHTAKAYKRLGGVYSEMGDFQKAFLNFEKAERYFEANKDGLNLLKNHINIFSLYTLMGVEEYHQELRYHIRKADSLQNLLMTAGVSINDEHDLAISQAKGNLADEFGDYREALEHHKKSLQISLQRQDFYEISMSYINLGITAANLNKFRNAYIYYNNALAYAEGDPATQSFIYDNLGDYYLKKKEYIKALESYQKAINYACGQTDISYTKMPSLERLELSPYKQDLLTYLTDKANAWILYYEDQKDKSHLTQALTTLELADKLVDNIRFESTEFQSKLFWRKKGADIYRKAVGVCYRLKLSKDAFYFMEKNKALLLLEDLTHENAKENAKLPETLAEREFKLKQNIHWEEEELIDAATASQTVRDSLINLIFDHKRSYEKFIDSLEVQYPDYYNYKRTLAVITYDNVLEKQQQDDVMLHYILGEEEGYGLLISHESSHFFKIDAVHTLHENINILRQKLTTPFVTKEDVENYQNTAFQLYTSLFPDVSPDFLTDKKIHIIPDHNLQQLPFEALMTSFVIPNAYLLHQCEISYTYSASFLDLNRAVERNPSDYFVGFAPVEFTSGLLDSLPMSDEEVTQIAGMFPGVLFMQEQALKQNFINSAFNYKVIHLATHADVGENTTPWIAFHDDRLSLQELYATKNQADLVVLSACNTSQGRLRMGEGLMSLARGFFSSGTRSVVATLWSADDRSTKEIMVDFYKQLRKGRTKAEALRYAKKQYLENHGSGSAVSPYYWSSLILIGETEALNPPPRKINNYLLIAIIGIGIIILLSVLWGRRYFRK